MAELMEPDFARRKAEVEKSGLFAPDVVRTIALIMVELEESGIQWRYALNDLCSNGDVEKFKDRVVRLIGETTTNFSTILEAIRESKTGPDSPPSDQALDGDSPPGGPQT